MHNPNRIKELIQEWVVSDNNKITVATVNPNNRLVAMVNPNNSLEATIKCSHRLEATVKDNR